MMELPESSALSKQIKKYLIGKKIDDIMILQTAHKFAFFKSDISKYSELLVGKTITDSTFHGGILEIHAEDTMISFADGVTPRIYKEKEHYPKKHQFALFFSDGTALICTIRMYGFIDVCPIGKSIDDFYISSSTKPNPMTEEFTYEHFRGLYKGEKNLTAKGLLATEQRIPGIGNGVIQDILWDAGIDPRFKMAKATEGDFKVLYNSTVKVIKEMCEKGGRDTENDILGNPGGYVTHLSNNTFGEPCPKCGFPIQRKAYLGGNIYFCEKCQKQ